MGQFFVFWCHHHCCKAERNSCNPRYMNWLKVLQEYSLSYTTKLPVGSLFINSNAKEGPDSAIKGWRGFFNAWGMIWDIILNVLSSKPLLRDTNGKPGSTCSAIPSRKDVLNCNTRGKIQALVPWYKISINIIQWLDRPAQVQHEGNNLPQAKQFWHQKLQSHFLVACVQGSTYWKQRRQIMFQYQ